MARLAIDLDSEDTPAVLCSHYGQLRVQHCTCTDDCYCRANGGKCSQNKKGLEGFKHRKEALAQHSSNSVEHYTPSAVVERAREVMGAIDLDPASHELAQTIVLAERWYGREHNGLMQQWTGRVWLNPPGGLAPAELSQISRSYPVIWWGKLWWHYMQGHVPEFCFMMFKLDMLQTTQGVTGVTSILSAADSICVPASRLAYMYPDSIDDAGRPRADAQIQHSTAPPCASGIVYKGPNVDKFRRLFGELGDCS